MISGSGLLAMRNKLQVTDHKIFAWAPLFWALSVTAAIAQEAVEADGADEVAQLGLGRELALSYWT